VAGPLDRQADCPSCGATITFKFAGARSLVCEYCHNVVARTDRGLVAQGRMADLLEIATPLGHGATGKWKDEPFEVIGRVQMDRAGAPGAPWQEILIWIPVRDATTWVAHAQGRWYATEEVPAAPGLPSFESLRPGTQVHLEQGVFVVQEVGQRRVVSGEGSMPNVPKPGAVTRYADISGAGGAFGTIDYGDGSEPPTLYVGRQFELREMVLDQTGLPPELPQAKAAVLDCPNCGGKLPLLSNAAERVVCQYCGTASDVTQGNLQALGPSPKPPIQPQIAIGAEGVIRGTKYVVCGFVIRSCRVEGVTYRWREYLLFGGEAVGYRWLMEEDGNWQFVEPIETGDVMDQGSSAVFRGSHYSFKQSVRAKVDYVIGEFYWKVEIGETVEATELEGPGGKVSREKSPSEVTYSFCTPMTGGELAPFGISLPAFAGLGGDFAGIGGGSGVSVGTIGIVIVVALVICALAAAGGGSSGVFVGGGSWSGGK
jgi:ribosomal protein S27E